jgi:MFS family permease
MQSLWDSLKADRKVTMTILIAALGYFVDIYDLVLFSVVRVASLKGIGIESDEMMSVGALLLNMQLTGFLIGGLIWGIMGDRVGRKQVLFGSILLYSLANIANAFVTTVDQYAICRLIAGIGLAGEIGAGITLVAELMPKHLRGYGTTFVASIGVSGGVLAGWTGHMFDWQTAYIFGGCMGLALLALRVGVAESLMFKAVQAHEKVKRGNLMLLINNRRRFPALSGLHHDRCAVVVCRRRTDHIFPRDWARDGHRRTHTGGHRPAPLLSGHHTGRYRQRPDQPENAKPEKSDCAVYQHGRCRVRRHADIRPLSGCN